MKILGISAYYHDSAACLLIDGNIIAAAQEERFSRLKNDPNFPQQAVSFCLEKAGLSISQLDAVVFYDKPLLKFERILETVLYQSPQGFENFASAIPIWGKEKLFLKNTLRKELRSLSSNNKDQVLPPLLFTEHHQSHAASAFFPSPFESAAILSVDGVGEWATTTTWQGRENQLTPLEQINFPHSLGLLYSAFTAYCGFEVNAGEYKLMGLAPYGKPIFKNLIYENLIDVKDDGSFHLNMDYFDYLGRLRMSNEKFHQLFGRPPREVNQEILGLHMDLASSIQSVIEDVLIKMAKNLKEQTGEKNLCMAGGVALNCVANEKIRLAAGFENIWVQPAAGDAGGALGACLSAWYEYGENPRKVAAVAEKKSQDQMRCAALGPDYSDEIILQSLQKFKMSYVQYANRDELYQKTAEYLEKRCVVGWFQGPMEFGPRALGHRSILADPRDPNMQKTLNLKIKFRESFRPFAPAVMQEHAKDIFDGPAISPYMLFVAKVKPEHLIASEKEQDFWGLDKLKLARSHFPAITHVDNSARIQTVDKESHPDFYHLIESFYRLTDCPVLINTSFNVKDEPIVCGPEEAIKCFMKTGMDILVVGPYLLKKEEQTHETMEIIRQEQERSDAAKPVSRDEMKKFSLGLGSAIFVMFGIVVSWIFTGGISRPFMLVGFLFAITGYFSPDTWRPLYKPWMGFVKLTGKWNSRFVLFLLYYVVLAPIGLVWRKFATTDLVATFQVDEKSYWVASQRRDPREHLKELF